MSRAAEKVLLEECLKGLRLPVMRRDCGECARQAKERGDRYEGFLLELARRELEQRRANQLKRRLKEARFPALKTLEKTDLNLWPGIEALQVRDLAACQWVAKKENLVLVGKHGTGKSHGAVMLGVEACRQGHRVLFTSAAQLANLLIEARAEHELQRYQQRLNRVPLLIVDELGYIPFSAKGAQLLFQVFADRYERASTLVTTNLPFAHWTKVFGDASLTAALLDRLTHRCTILEFNWESIRLAQSLKRKRRAGGSGASASAPPPEPPAKPRKEEKNNTP